MEAPDEFKEKLRKLQTLDNVLIHYTTVNNAISALKHGLMSLNDARDRGIEPEKGGYHFPGTWIPEAVSLINPKDNILKDRDFFSTLTRNLLLIIDGKYLPEIESYWDQEIYRGIISNEGIVAIVKIVDIPGPLDSAEEVMALQREKLSEEKWTPVFYADDKVNFLCVPSWLEISEEFDGLKEK